MGPPPRRQSDSTIDALPPPLSAVSSLANESPVKKNGRGRPRKLPLADVTPSTTTTTSSSSSSSSSLSSVSPHKVPGSSAMTKTKDEMNGGGGETEEQEKKETLVVGVKEEKDPGLLLPPSSSRSGPYQVNEDVDCLYKGMFYPARILDILTDPSNPKKLLYKVHYMQFNKRYDEIVDGSRLSRNSETVSPAKLSVSKNRAQKRPSGAADTDSPSNDKRRKENSRYFESEIEAVHKNKFDLPLSKELQRILLADWTEIRRGKKMTLPCYPTVAEITRMFIEQRRKRDEIDADGIRPSDVMHVVLEHFRFSLPKILLYENEKDVLDEIKTSTSENVEGSQSSSCLPSWEEIFGGIHLLRLLVKIPEILAFSTISFEAAKKIIFYLKEFIEYLSRERKSLFSVEYNLER